MSYFSRPLLVVLMLATLIVPISVANAQSATIQAQIQGLLAQVMLLQARLAELTGKAVLPPPPSKGGAVYQVTPNGVPYSLKTAIEAAKTNTTSPSITIALADGVYDMSVHSNTMCGNIPCITFNGVPDPSRISLIGNKKNPERVVLRFAKPAKSTDYSPGGFYLYEDKDYGTLDGFTMEGPYSGWKDRANHVPDTTPFPDPSSITFTTMALWATNGADVKIGPNVRVKNFYFGIFADGPGTSVHAEKVRVEGCGDSGFYAGKGAALYANDTEASWCAAYGWGLGVGYASESVYPHSLYAYSDSDPKTDDVAIRSYAYDYAKGVRASIEKPLLSFIDAEIKRNSGRTLLIADRSKSHDNLMTGYLANVGGKMQIKDAIAYRNGLGSESLPSSLTRGGIAAQANGIIDAQGAISYRNEPHSIIALLASEINARHAKSFGNGNHGFYALEQGSVIYAQGASSFSYGADQKYGFGAERDSKIYIDSGTKAGSDANAFSFIDPIVGSKVRVTPKAHTQWDFSPTVGVTWNNNAVIIDTTAKKVSQPKASSDLKAGIDLMVEPTPSLSTSRGASFTMSATVSNDGAEATPGSFYNVWRVCDANCVNYDKNGNSQTSALSGGVSRSVSFSHTIDAAPGLYYYMVCSDVPHYQVTESDEGNNCSSWQTVTVQ